MNRIPRDEEREHRIAMEAIVDAYGAEEQALGWYYSVEAKIRFPFTARCREEWRISPLREGEQVMVKGMIPEEEAMYDLFVEIEWQGRTLGVPLAQLEPLDVDEETQEAIADWRYWVQRGYRFV